MIQRTPIENYLLTIENKSLLVLFWLLRNRDKENVIHTTLQTVATECGVTKVTVNKTFQKLYKKGFMEKMRNGVYKLDKV